jgi:hypothetical protein
MTKPRTLSLLWSPFDRLVDPLVTRLFIKGDGAFMITPKVETFDKEE